jgi:2-polyprenyl-3-methyl-5-hydroxy-6-metoxy-1,4-benzoquinol methylase
MVAMVPLDVATLLDVGCGTGGFGLALKQERSISVTGVETSAEAAAVAKGRLDRVLEGSIDNHFESLKGSNFDCIVFNDVLEHMVDPWATLREAVLWLRPKGYVLASIPNVRYFQVLRGLLLRREWKYEDSGVLDRTHLRFFTASAVRELFESTGYRVLTLKGVNGGFTWKFSLLNRLLFNALSDTRYLQNACLATPRE